MICPKCGKEFLPKMKFKGLYVCADCYMAVKLSYTEIEIILGWFAHACYHSTVLDEGFKLHEKLLKIMEKLN